MQIPEHQIEEIKNSTDIVDLISTYVHLKPRGKNFIGLCPFHNEKTPSFTVSREKQIYHCFGCHAGGNVFRFLMEYKNISFVESVKELAENLGIKIEETHGANTEEKSEFEELYEINIVAARFFSDNLLNNPKGEIARKYFENRKIKLQTIKIFGLGFAFSAWDALLNQLKKNNVNLQKAKEIGLIDKKDNGDYYDKYRNRTIFPIFSPNGRVIAFGGRIMNAEEKTAKYINSPESKIYSKRKTLYGLYHSKEEIRKQDMAILVEGYMDVISLFQNNVKNVVASSGTALTEEQVLLLSRFTKNIVVNFDSDPAGQKAATRSIELLLKNNFDVKLISLPNGEDPDSFIVKYGTKEFNKQIDEAKDFLEFRAEQFEKAGAFKNPTDTTNAIRELVKYISLVEDELKQNIFIKSISKKFNLREKLIERELDTISENLRKKNSKVKINPDRKSFGAPSPQTAHELDNTSFKFEKDIIKLMLEGNTEIIENIFDYIFPEDFSNKTYRTISKIIEKCYTNGDVSTSTIIGKITNKEIRDVALKLSMNDEMISNKWNEKREDDKIELNHLQYAKDIIKKYRISLIDKQIKANRDLLAVTTNEEKIVELLQANQELTTQKKMLLDGYGESDLI